MENLEADLFTKVRELIPGRFFMTNVISRRLEQLIRGSEPRISPAECEGLSKLEIALTEIAGGHITIAEKVKEEEEELVAE